jgi:lipid-A-disaccharide synthase
MREVITRAAVILPFEERLLRDHGINATFVGHPLLDAVAGMPDRAEARRRLGIDAGAQVLALFPGSRHQEIVRHLDDFVKVAEILRLRRPGLEVVACVAPTVDIAAADVPFRLVRAPSFDVLRAADVALCKSGTTTLEAAIAGCPFAIVYRINPLTFAFVRRIVRVAHIGLVNIVAGRRIVPEFVQDAFVPAAVAEALDPLFDANAAVRQAMVAALADVRQRLGDPGAADRVARMALEMAT